MRRGVILGVFVAVLGVGAYGVFCRALPGGERAMVDGALAAERGRATGSFDPKMSGVCRFSCAAPQAHGERDAMPQPGVGNGVLTQCPVSGVVFVVDEQRPRITLVTGDYVVCCDGCAGRLRKNPGRFIHL